MSSQDSRVQLPAIGDAALADAESPQRHATDGEPHSFALHAAAQGRDRGVRPRQRDQSVRGGAGGGGGRRVCGLDRGLLVAVVVGSLGNVLEWLDFSVFGYFSIELGELFFPSDDPLARDMEALAVFAGAFVMRPIGGVLFGYIGDRIGRKRAVVASILTMGASSLTMGLLPTYETAGIGATLALVAVRMAQGLSVGGQLVGAFVLLVELAPPGQRALFGAICLSGANFGTALGSAVSALVRGATTHEQLLSWGWRVPFLCGSVVALVTLLIKHQVPESGVFEALQARRAAAAAGAGGAAAPAASELAKSPAREVMRRAPWHLAAVTGGSVVWCCGVYVFAVFVPTYMAELADPPLASAFAVNTLTMVFVVCWMPFFGLLADRKASYATVMIVGSLLMAALDVPMFAVLAQGTPASLVLAQLVMGLGLVMHGSSLGSWMVGVCPAELRYTTVAVGYNLAQALFGGTAPLVCTALVAATGSPIAPGLYLAGLALVSAATLAVARRANLNPNTHLRGRDGGGDGARRGSASETHGLTLSDALGRRNSSVDDDSGADVVPEEVDPQLY